MKNKKLDPKKYQGHQLKTRRDFLAHGLIQLSGLALGPTLIGSLIQSLESKVYGQTNPTANYPWIPFFTLDLAGGAALPGNFLVGGRGGPEDLLPSYNTLGWDPRRSTLEKRFGLPMAPADISKFLQGMLDVCAPEALEKISMASICHTGLDDTDANPLSSIILVSNLGYKGTVLKNSLGTVISPSGGRSTTPLLDAGLTPLYVGSVNNFTDNLSIGDGFKNLSKEQLERLATTSQSLSDLQLSKLLSMPGHEQLRIISERAYQESKVMIGQDKTKFDPRFDPNISKLFSIDQKSRTDNLQAIIATIVKNVMEGVSGPGTITLGGYDYHNDLPLDNEEHGDNYDLQAGLTLGRIVQTAHLMQKPVFFQIITDGGVASNEGSRIWSSESGIRSMTVMGMYDPKKKPELKKHQIGHYLPGQIASNETLLGGSTMKVAYAVLANYIVVNGRSSELNDLLPRDMFSAEELEEILVFG